MSRFEKWSVWTTSILTVLTGVGYFATKYLVSTADPFAVVNHPLQPWFLKAHILVSPLLLFALGLITVRHVWKHFRSGVRWSRKSGITATITVVPMVATGYLIQTLTGTGWVRAMAISHIVFGFLYALGLAAHQWIIRTKKPPPANGRNFRRPDPNSIMKGAVKTPDVASDTRSGRGTRSPGSAR